MLPKVSVIIPTYNYAKFIITAIEKVLSQDYPRDLLEIIVVDDGSIDDTKNVLQQYVSQKEIQYYYQDNQGKAAATQQAINMCSGKYIFNLDADDFYFPDKISESVKIFESDESIVHVSSPAKVYKQDTQTTETYEIVPEVLANKPLDGNWLIEYFYSHNLLLGGGSTYGARASILKKIKVPSAVDMYIDEFLILAILPYGKSYLMSRALSVWRDHGTNYSGFSGISNEARIKKYKRLLDSSEAIYLYLRENKFSSKAIKLAKLRYLNSQIAFSELTDQKTFLSILTFANEVFIKIRPSLSVTKAYSLVNRLVPTIILKKLKKRN